jgi:hypothetical protein
VPRAGANFTEGMKFGRTWRAKEAVPGIGTEAQDAGKSAFEGSKTDSAKKRGEIGTEGKDPDAISVTGIDRDDEKNRGVGEWRGNGLRGYGGRRGLGADGVGRHWSMTCWNSGENFEKSPAQRVISGKDSLAKFGE